MLFPLDLDDFRSLSIGTAVEFKSVKPGPGHDHGIYAAAAEKADAMFHICLATDHYQREGLFALINSILRNTKTPEKFYFHILVDDHTGSFERILDASFEIPFRYEIESLKNADKYRKQITFLEKNIRVEGGAKESSRIRNLMNFARIYLPEFFPQVDVGLYLDVDMIVQTDLGRLFATNLSSAIVAATLNRTFDHYHTDLNMVGNGFNAGILLINFDRWREEKVTDAIKEVMTKHRQRKLFHGGTQPLLNVIFYRRCLGLDHLWNVTDLGFREGLDSKLLMQARILHWNGNRKPWLENGLYKNLWEGYRIAIPVTGK